MPETSTGSPPHEQGDLVATTATTKTPAEQLLDLLGPVDRYHDHAANGDFGMPARATMEDYLEPHAYAGPQSRLGPLEKAVSYTHLTLPTKRIV